MWHRRFSLQTQHSFGLTPEWLQGRIESSYAYRAIANSAPINLRFNNDIYHGFHLLFTAIQLAGPDLTLANLQAGLSSYSVTGTGATQATGSFDAASGNRFTFLRSALAWSWDPTGQEPGRILPNGCLRTEGNVAIDGLWTHGDSDIPAWGWGNCMGPHVLGGPESNVL